MAKAIGTVFPTHVGVERTVHIREVRGSNIPHAPGGGPIVGAQRRCAPTTVFPAPVGGPVSGRMMIRPYGGIFRTRGVDRTDVHVRDDAAAYSPRPWGVGRCRGEWGFALGAPITP